ncbi:MAG: AraC family transcriptional regulator [Kiritimatiellae bacterium]|jgi:AraC-like DNA-binding protein/mannose-6-phosphate isomerase-like protein (cupin superfamily)|nr:AraC family transcriptional regulator [Kiritimatiellia bacterium]
MKLHAEKIQLLPGESFRLLQWRNNIHDVEIVAGDGTRYPLKGSGDQWHYHSHMELTLITQGMGTLFIGDAIKHFTAPDLVMIGPNLPHYWQMRNHSSGCALQFDFEPEHPFWHIPETRGLDQLWKDAERGIHITGDIVTETGQLLQTAVECGGMERLVQFMTILSMLSKTKRKNRQTISSTAFAPVTRHATYRSLQKAIHLIFQNFQEELPFSDILSEAGMSKATFERHFKKLTGKTFTRFLTDLRLNYAGRQLIETELPVSEIAFSSGYNNLSHFNHQFKALHQMSPLAFRKKMTQELSP